MSFWSQNYDNAAATFNKLINTELINIPLDIKKELYNAAAYGNNNHSKTLSWLLRSDSDAAIDAYKLLIASGVDTIALEDLHQVYATIKSKSDWDARVELLAKHGLVSSLNLKLAKYPSKIARARYNITAIQFILYYFSPSEACSYARRCEDKNFSLSTPLRWAKQLAVCTGVHIRKQGLPTKLRRWLARRTAWDLNLSIYASIQPKSLF